MALHGGNFKIFSSDFIKWFWTKHGKSIFARRAYVIGSLLLIYITVLGLLNAKQILALTQAFVQTDWSGGADTVSTASDANLTGWTKYYSVTDGIELGTAGEIKLKLESSQP